MILKFPDLDTLKLVLINGAVPPSVSLAPATAGFDEQRHLWLEPSVTPARKAQDELKKYNVLIGKRSGTALSARISCWLEMLPLVRESEFVAPPEQTPVLFDLPSGEQLTRLATEILRLGNDRQSYRWLDEKDGSSRALLRVIGPPYYSLLRALDSQGPQAPRAFVERAARVWVQLGYTHPFVERIKPPEKQILLLRPPRQWTYLPEQSYRDIYDILDFQLPGAALSYREGELKGRLRVALHLARGGGTEPAELWVLRNDPVAELNNLVQHSEDQLLSRLSFAVGESKGRQTILLRVRPSKLPPPVLVVDGVAFRQYLKLPNLFLPCGWRLHPPLRRDILRKLLAEDPAVLTWLHPGEKEGEFTPETIAENSFRPLTDWVDYVIDSESAALQTWVQSHQFDFDSFICDEDGQEKKKKPPPPDKGRERGKGGGTFQEVEVPAPKDPAGGAMKILAPDDPVSLVPPEPSAQQVRLRQLEEQFVALEGALDVPERLALWPDLAHLNTALVRSDRKYLDDAGICWMNTLWNDDDWSEAFLWGWFRLEAGAVTARQEKGPRQPSPWTAAAAQSARPREVPGEDLDRLLAGPTADLADTRALAAYLVWASRRDPAPAELVKRLSTVGHFLEANEDRLSVRGTWLAWTAFARLTGGDVLALARARDRVLERLFEHGLKPEADLPGFLRLAGQPATQRFRGVRQWMLELCERARRWSKETSTALPSEGDAPTLAFIQLLFAYGLARIGEVQASRELIEQAGKELKKGGEAHRFLLEAYQHRIGMAQEGRRNAGPLPPPLLDWLRRMDEQIKKLQPPAAAPGPSEQEQRRELQELRMQRYCIDRMRHHSKILEPEEKVDPYAEWGARIDDLSRKLAEIVKLPDRQEMADRLLRLLREAPKGSKGHEPRMRTLRACMDVAPHVGDAFSQDVLGQLITVWDALPESGEVAALLDRTEVLERALFVAAHFDRRDHVQALVARFQHLLLAQRGSTQAMRVIEKLGRESLRGLRKLGMRDEIDVLLRQMEDVILEGKGPASLMTLQADHNGPAALRTLLHVASGWLYFSREREAEPILNAGRALLFGGDWKPNQVRERAALANVYARTVGGVSADLVRGRLEEIFERLTDIRATVTTSPYYNLLHLDLIESVVMAIAGEDQTLSGNARRWLDDDEFIVRRRIHRDFYEARAKA
jgi:hypothetical protein